MVYLKLVILLTVFALVGCSNDGSDTTSKVIEPTEEEMEAEATVFDSQVHAIEKTRNVENVLQESADRRQKDLDVQ